MDIISVKLTDYGTVKILDENGILKRVNEETLLEEMKVNRFYDFFEKGIKKYQITECMYDIEKNRLIFSYKNIQFEIPMENTHSGDGVILLNLVKLEEEIRRQKKYEDIIKDKQEELLKEARLGNIHSEEARQLYIKELKDSISLKAIWKKIGKIVFGAVWDADHCPALAVTLGIILASLSLFLCIGSFFMGYIVKGIVWLLWGIAFVVTASIAYDVNIYELIVLCMYRSIRQITEEVNMVNHKLKYLRKYELPKNLVFSKITIDSFNESVSLKLHEIYEKLLMLSESERTLLRGTLANKINEVKKNIDENSNVDDINSEFLRYLLEFEREIDILLDKVEEDKKSYAFTGNARGMVMNNSEVKIRRMKRQM